MKRICLYLVLLLLASHSYGQSWGIEGKTLLNAIPDGNVNAVWQGENMPHGFSGEGVIIGVTDWGFDYTHPVFYDTSLTDRKSVV